MHEHMFVSRRVRFTERDLRAAITASRTWAETLRRLGYRTAGGNWLTLKKYAARWQIPTDHFDPDGVRNEALSKASAGRRPLAEILVRNSSYSRQHLKSRLFAEGLKQRRCEACGQGELWRGDRMALILDHVNGVPDDHRIENLRVLCPNCAATLDTHCVRKNRIVPTPRPCPRCGVAFIPSRRRQKYCSRECGSRWERNVPAGPSSLKGRPRPGSRRVRRPPYAQLLKEIDEAGFAAVGRRYGVSDNAVRKWVRFYENERERRHSPGDALSGSEDR